MIADDDQDRLDDDFVDRLASLDQALATGETPISNAGSSPEMQARLKRGMAALKALRHMTPAHDLPSTLDRRSGQTLHAVPQGPTPKQLDRFEILRELGRGGFGIVFLARDPKLHREVALKVPHAAAMVDDALRQRFRREAQAAAGLEHPNIVPVYEADEQGPICWIAYAYCPGETLSHWLARQSSPVPVNDAASLIATLADALDHAHGRGILHRDLKPANILIAVGSQPLVTAKITDFGLAKLADDSAGMTKAGAVIGTPAYMAPEQAQARSIVDGRADVYALGAILYELLTGRPPFRGETDLETLQLVKDSEPVAPRQLRPKLPRDLETVCLKCLDKDPNRRYATAADLRDDLRRFLAGEHVRARPISSPARLARWCRRRPAITGLIIALVAAIGIGAAGIARQYRLANTERDTAVAERDRSVRLLAQAHDLLDRLHTLGEELRRDTHTAVKGREILQETLGYYQKLLHESGGDPIFQSEIARVAKLAGVTYRDLGRLEEAISTYQTGLDALKILEKQDPSGKDLLERRVELMVMQSDSMRNAGHRDDAKKVLQECETLAALQDDGAKQSPALIRTYGQTLLELGTLIKDDADLKLSVAKMEKATEVFRKLVQASPDDFELRSDLAHALEFLGAAQTLDNELDAAQQAIQESLKLSEELWKQRPRSLRSQLAVAMAHGRLGDIAMKRGQSGDAIECNKRAAVVYDEAATSCPHIPQVHRDYARLLVCLADLYESQKRYDEAGPCLDKAVYSRLRLVEIQPTSTRRRLDLAYALFRQGRVAMARKDVTAAREAIKRARIQLNHLKPTTTIPELVKELKALTESVDQLEKQVNGKAIAKPNTTPVID